jgi:3-oxoacyl-[acyl-carrier-protein] synthase III
MAKSKSVKTASPRRPKAAGTRPVAAKTVRATITGVHGHLPDYVLTNAELASMVDTTDDWITERTGIRTRHILKGKGMGSSHMGAEAVRGLLDKTRTLPKEVDLLICATTTPDFVFPSTANLICDMVGIRNIGSFDVQAACSGFLYAVTIAKQFIENGAAKKIIVVGADKMSSIIDYTDRATCVIFGDGAGAVLLEPAGEGEEGILDFIHEVDGAGGCSLNMPGGGSLNPSTHETVDKKMHFVHQDGQAVFKYAVRKMADASAAILARNGLTGKDVDCFIPHQANKRIITATADRLGMPMERVIVNIDRYGNTTAGTIPLAMQSAIEEGKLKKGDMVLLASVGAGFTTAATLLRWAF